MYFIPWLRMVLLLSHTRLCNLNYFLDSTLLRGWTHMILRPRIFLFSSLISPSSNVRWIFFPVFFTADVQKISGKWQFQTGTALESEVLDIKNSLCGRQCFPQSCHCFWLGLHPLKRWFLNITKTLGIATFY